MALPPCPTIPPSQASAARHPRQIIHRGTLLLRQIAGSRPADGRLLSSLCKWMTGWTARTHPDQFCRAMTLASSGLAYVVAVLCIYRLGRPLRLSLSVRLGPDRQFRLGHGGPALRPARQQSHPPPRRDGRAGSGRRAVSGRQERGPGVGLALRRPGHAGGTWDTRSIWASVQWSWFRTSLFCPESLPPPVACGAASASPGPPVMSLFVLGALPWLVLHHALNYAIGGTFQPANANPEYFCWPGSPFSARNLTGKLGPRRARGRSSSTPPA